jgi:hypothetical protein
MTEARIVKLSVSLCDGEISSAVALSGTLVDRSVHDGPQQAERGRPVQGASCGALSPCRPATTRLSPRSRLGRASSACGAQSEHSAASARREQRDTRTSDRRQTKRGEASDTHNRAWGKGGVVSGWPSVSSQRARCPPHAAPACTQSAGVGTTVDQRVRAITKRSR